MGTIRKHGRINENTFLIDSYMFGVSGIGAFYLVHAGKSCLIDTGTPKEAPRIAKVLKQLGAFPPDYVILTHAHWDHSQGLPYLRKKAGEGKITVLASEKSIPLLADQSFNKIFKEDGHFEDIYDVQPLKDGDVIDLDGLTLRVVDVPGHIEDHIALFDEKHKNLFVGDALGLNLSNGTNVPPFMPPYFDKEAFYKTVEKIKQLPYESISLVHFGFLDKEDAKALPDAMAQTLERWWEVYTEIAKEGKLDDKKYIAETLLEKLHIEIPEFKVMNPFARLVFKVINFFRKLFGKRRLTTAHILLPELSEWLAKGYEIYHRDRDKS